MGLIDFVKAAGRKIGIGDDQEDRKEEAAARRSEAQAQARARAAAADRAQAQADAAKSADRVEQLDRQEEIMDFVKKFDFDVKNFGLHLEDDIAIVTGEAATQIDREKAVLVVGNHEGIAAVDDRMTVSEPAPESQFHTVVRGDTLSKIAKAYYGDAMKYPQIFDANRPMLTDPDLIYPGQVLRIPPLD